MENTGTSLQESVVCASWSRDSERRINSTSGGIFSELAQWVYEQNGCVVGAVYNEDFSIHHILSEHPEDLDRLRQSKYAQSDIGRVFREVDCKLKEGRTVLFCGTPCHAAGLRAYLKGDVSKLILCDFICRGINSPKAYQSYLDMLSNQHASNIERVQFKNKDHGWNQFHTKVTFDDGSVYSEDRAEDLFMQAYLRHNLIIRPSCHACAFKTKFRNTDLTLGDFWGIGNAAPELDSNEGTSVVIASSSKGVEVMDAIQDRIVVVRRSIEEVMAGNVCLSESARPGRNRQKFFSEIDTYPFDELMKRYGKLSMTQWCKAKARRYMNRLKRLINK